ncbi:H-NS histone family protein (plasmid) [Paraburkholderia acidicola]|uniref:H-NS histone family protein n=1 Tax=Paraburkholderia acidicola TaxID=1912599 RepID=A0ABV1LYP8_9BURK
MAQHRELKAQLEELNERIDQARVKEAPDALLQIRELVALFGFSQSDVFGVAPGLRKTRAQAKYRDPETGRTWSGRGARPKWLKDKSIEQYRLDL